MSKAIIKWTQCNCQKGDILPWAAICGSYYYIVSNFTSLRMHPSSNYLLLLVSSKSLKCTLPVKGFTILQFLPSLGYFNNLCNQCENAVKVTSLCLQQVLEELKKSNFTLLNQNIQFDENGDFKSGSYSIVFWNQTGDAQEIGFYSFYPSVQFFINNTMIKWYTDGDVSCVF